MDAFFSRSLSEVLQAYFSPSEQRMQVEQLRSELEVACCDTKELHFEYLTIEKASIMKSFAKVMSLFKDFTSLKVSACYIADDCFYYLAKGLRKLTAIERISIMDDEFSANKADYLCMAVENMPKLSYLELSGRELSLATCRVLCTELPKLNSLLTLNVNVTNLGYGQVDLCRVLRFMPQLRNLFLFNVELGKKKGLKKLGKSLQSTSDLEKLDLSSNDLSRRWDLLSPAFSQLHRLSSLRLSNCNLHDTHLNLLSRSFLSLQTLTELDLSYNELRFTVSDLESINITALRSLTLLNIEWNLVSQPRLRVLILQLPLVDRLESLGINNRFFDVGSYETLLLVLPTLVHLQTVFSVFEHQQKPPIERLAVIYDCYFNRG